MREPGRNVHVVGWLGLGSRGFFIIYIYLLLLLIFFFLGGGGGGTGCFLFVVAQHLFHAIHSQSPSRTLGQYTRDLG